MYIVGFGNALMDTVVNNPNESLVLKYDLNGDGQREIDEFEMQQIELDIEGSTKIFAAGGCAQNTLRILKWLLPLDVTAIMIGAVGNDNAANELRRIMKKANVIARYSVRSACPTGRTVSFTKGSNRYLVACLGAAKEFNIEQLAENNPDLEKTIQNAQYVYLEGFFIVNDNNREIAKYVLALTALHNVALIFNISGVYVCDKASESVKLFAKSCNILLGNRQEFAALASIMSTEMGVLDVDNFASILAQSKKDKLVVVTNGEKAVHSFLASTVVKVEPQQVHVIDSTGAGDAFAAGFIAGLCQGKNAKICTIIGNYAAKEVVQRWGCTIPDFPSLIMEDCTI